VSCNFVDFYTKFENSESTPVILHGHEINGVCWNKYISINIGGFPLQIYKWRQYLNRNQINEFNRILSDSTQFRDGEFVGTWFEGHSTSMKGFQEVGYVFYSSGMTQFYTRLDSIQELNNQLNEESRTKLFHALN